MARKSPQPAAGNAYAFPLNDGRFAVCRILKRNDDSLMAACSSWIGAEIPDSSDSALRDILQLTHHAHRGHLLIHWVPKRLPKDFTFIGQIAPSDEEANMDCQSHGYWDSITCQPLKQWRWDNDREASNAADESDKRQRDKMAELAAARRTAYLQSLTLEKLSTETPLPNWSGHVDTPIVRRGRKIIRESVKQLLTIGRRGPKPEKVDAMNNCMTSLVHLGVQEIDTESRYEVFDDIEAMAYACGIPEELDHIYSNRNW